MKTLADYTDFDSHRIEGYARAALEKDPEADGWFRVPLISHVEGNLWQGGCHNMKELPTDFEYVVSLYPWERYILGPKTHRDEIEMYDHGTMPDIKQLHEIARKVNEYRARGKTLVHCQAGLNRSGLVAGLALILGGMEPKEAIALLRKQRCDMVLCNETFENWLRNYGSKK